MSYQPVPTHGMRPGVSRLLRRWLRIAGLAAVFLAAAGFLGVVLGMELGGRAAVLATLAALLPLGVVVPAFLWLDRYEAEPPGHLLFAFGWGALIATTVALVLNTGSMIVLGQVSRDGDALAAVVVAPVVEESLKGLGVLLLLLRRRREFDGIIDGIVYAGVCAAGFAFAENILYLGRALAEAGAEGMVAVFVVRCVFGPFAHPLFTCCTGVGIGVAATSRSRAAQVLAPLLGFIVAVSLHALWNVSAVLGLEGFVSRYVVMQLPIFLAALLFALWARRREGHLIGVFLQPYVATGWLGPQDQAMLADLRARRAARAWAATYAGPRGKASMRVYQDTASELALLRQRIEHGTAHPDAAEEEIALLRRLLAARGGFTQVPGAAPLSPVR